MKIPKDHAYKDHAYMDTIRKILLADWDPLCVGENPNLADEYDVCIPSIYRVIQSQGSRDQLIACLLNAEQTIGAFVDEQVRMSVAEKLLRTAVLCCSMNETELDEEHSSDIPEQDGNSSPSTPQPSSRRKWFNKLVEFAVTYVLVISVFSGAMFLAHKFLGNAWWAGAPLLIAWFVASLRTPRIHVDVIAIHEAISAGDQLAPKDLFDLIKTESKFCEPCRRKEEIRMYRVRRSEIFRGLPSRTINYCPVCRQLVSVVPIFNAVGAVILSACFAALCMGALGVGLYMGKEMILSGYRINPWWLAISLILVVVSLAGLNKSIDFCRIAILRELPLSLKVSLDAEMP